MYWLKTFLWATHSLCNLYRCYGTSKTSCPCTHWVRIVNFMGIHDTLWAVILPLIGWPFRVFLMKQFSENIPTELLESAKIDGCGEIRTFWSVALSYRGKPGFVALAIFTFINTWNDYFMQLVMLTSRNNLTISLVLRLCRLKWQPTMV